MAEYIEREAFREFWNKEFRHLYPNDTYLVALANFPTADVVEVRHGEWIEGKTLEKCSLCGKKGFPDWRYCPHCGAKMDGKDGAE